ncbi:MAG TPA: hypothetical protein VN025_08100 [Candidatus Dormibacteraeota bacterium]|nr:hypothetical protein [Candidatus Dormibacteraeota bacterium]
MARLGSVVLLVLVSAFLEASSQESKSSVKLILQVINKHHTIGQAIPSVYIRVFSDGRVECHTVQYTGKETDIPKSKTLTGDELKALKALLENPELMTVDTKYGLMYTVIDSWMEWDFTVPHGPRVQKIHVLNFAPSAARERNLPYPSSLEKLGCSIRKIRRDLYEDEPTGVDCQKLLAVQ